MIDINTGHLLIDTECTITPQTSLATIEKWELDITQKTRSMGDRWNWVDVKNLKIKNLYLNISFFFKDKKIGGFTFTFQDKPYDLNPSWDSWSKETEETNLVRFNNWLEEQFGEVRTLEWGTVEAFYDSKSGGSSINLSYI
ncbi:MAG: hypothetical protein ACI976_000448 [Aureispira sp.]|jgi:hypothetical protein